ncbi:unnamed protein product [Scytosiphon promiscuus]
MRITSIWECGLRGHVVSMTMTHQYPLQSTHRYHMFHRAPQEFSIATMPAKRKPSITKLYGIRLEIGSGLFPAANREQKFACLASNLCRVTLTLFEISKDQTTGGTQHLKESHGNVARSSARTAKR